MSGTIQLRVLALAELHPDKAQVRRDLGDLDELAASIRTSGLLQPLIITQTSGRYLIVDGHRRHAAAKAAGLDVVPCLVTPMSGRNDLTAVQLATAMSKALNPVEQARAFKQLQDTGMTVAMIARRTGYSPATIQSRVQLLDLPADALRLIERRELGLTDALDLAQQVRAKGTGSVAKKAPKAHWLTFGHRLARPVQDRCAHTDTQVKVGGVGCGQCWEAEIRADEQRTQSRALAEAVSA